MAKILLAEDDNNLREIYQARLIAEGYDVVAAQNGEEALALAKQEKPDLIVSDVMMPRISGFEMLDILRNTDGLKETKVIMLTALGQADDRSRADNLGADKYLVKSQVTLEDIVTSAKQMLGGGVGTGAIAQPTDDATSSVATASEPTSTDTAVASSTVVPDTADPATGMPNPVAPQVAPAEPLDAPTTDASQASEASAPVPPEPVVDPMTTATDDDLPHIPEPTAEVIPTPSVEVAEADVASSTPQSLEAEEQALQAQLDSLVGGETSATPAQPEVTALGEAPAEPMPSVENAPEAIVPEAQAVAEPQLTAPEPVQAPVVSPELPTETAPEVTAPEAVVAEPQVTPVVEPTSEPAGTPNLEDLVAQELATAQATPTAEPSVAPAPAMTELAQPAVQTPAEAPSAPVEATAGTEEQPRVINPDINNMAL